MNTKNTEEFSFEDPNEGELSFGEVPLIVIRHGETDLNKEDKARGWDNTPLSDEGKQQAKDIGLKLQNEAVEGIITSDLERAKETAEIISKTADIPIIEKDKELRTWNIGKLVGQPSEEADKVTDEYAKDKPDEKVDGGESFNEFKDRFIGAIQDIQKEHAGEKLAIVCHHQTQCLLDAWAKAGYPEDKSIDLETYLKKGIEPGKSKEYTIS